MRQCFDQRLLVDDAAPRDVDQIPVRTQRLDHPAVDQLSGTRATRRRDDQYIHAPGQLHRRRHIGVLRVGDLVAIVVRDGAAKSAEPLCNRTPDAAEPNDPDPRVAHLARQRIHPVDRPPARPHIPVGRRELPHHIDHQAHCGVRHAVGQHVGRIAHADPASRRGIHIYRLVSDTEVHDGAQLRQRRHQAGIHTRTSRCHHHRDLAAMQRQERVALSSFVGQHIGRVVVLKGLRQRRLQRPNLKDGPTLLS